MKNQLAIFNMSHMMLCKFILTHCNTQVAICLLLIANSVNAQLPMEKRVSSSEIITMAKNNLQYSINSQQIDKGRVQVYTTTPFSKTGLFAENEDLRPGDRRGILKVGISQSISWPGVYKAQKKLYREQLEYHEANAAVIDIDLKKDIRSAYYQLWYLLDKKKLFIKLDSIYRSLSAAASLKVRAGDSPGLDSISAGVRMKELQALVKQVGGDIQIQQQLLKQLLNTPTEILPLANALEKLASPIPSPDTSHPSMILQSHNIDIAGAGIVLARNENKPEFSGRFFSQRLYGASDPYTGFSITAAFPLFGSGAYRNKIRAAQAEATLQQKQYDYAKQIFASQLFQAQQEVEKNNVMLEFYETAGLKQAGEIIKASSLAYRTGEIGFSGLSQFLTQAIEIQRNYLEVLNAYNQSVIQYNYYINQ